MSSTGSRLVVIPVNCFSHCQVDWLTDKMRKDGFAVSSLHGMMKQKDRDLTMNEFRSAKRYVSQAETFLKGSLHVENVSVERK